MNCRITGKICGAWSEVAGCGLVRCKFMEKKDGGEILNGETVKDRHYMTNADRIRAMTDEELANLLTDYSNNCGWVTEIGRKICYERIVDWLQQPAEEDDHA